MDFDYIATYDPFLKITSRQLLSLASSEEVDDADIRLQGDVQRTMAFLTSFSVFVTVWCSLSCYIYNRPHDGPGGRGLVSCIRRTPFLKWFFAQPQNQAKNEPKDETEIEPLTTVQIQEDVDGNNQSQTQTNSKTTAGGDDTSKAAAALAPPPTQSPSKRLFCGDENSTLAVCGLGLLISYLTWGFMQERIMGHPYGDPDNENNWFKYSSFCVLINRFFGVFVSTICLKFFVKASGNFAPPYVVSLCALSNMSSSWFQYEALHYVTFPVQTIVKSSKILVTMGVGKFVLKKTFPWSKYANAFVIAIGVYIFLSSQQSSDDSDDDSSGGDNDENDLGMYFYLGLAMICGYAFCDAFTSNWQQRVFKATNVSSFEMMQSVNAFTFTVSLCFVVADLSDIYTFYVDHPQIIVHSLIMGLCAGFGQTLIFYTIQNFGAMKFATVMTTRMMVSVIVSILYYGHSITMIGSFGLIITFVALYYQAYSKGSPRKAPPPRNR